MNQVEGQSRFAFGLYEAQVREQLFEVIPAPGVQKMLGAILQGVVALVSWW